jgi:diacylglycerol O-acyltransferase / wax synthase
MEHLAGTDSYFLYTERGNVYNHVASLGIYDPSTAPGGKVRFKDILRYFGNRLDASPLFRRRLVTVPHGFDRPYLLDDPDLDLEFHVRHIALPEPGDWRQLMIQVARIHSRPLDRSRPLWEVYVIEGLDRIPGLPVGSFALFMKFHHASIDGQAGAQLLRAVHSLSALADDPGHDGGTLYAERDPTAIELYSRAITHGVGRATGISKLYASTLARIAGLTLDQVNRKMKPGREADDAALGLPGFVKAPLTRFNRPVSANRVVEAVALPLDRMKAACGKLEGVTINDLFLAIVGGALRRYLESKEELPATSLMALMPINVREEGRPSMGGNQVGGAPVPVHSDIADPLKRLKAVHHDSRSAKRGAEILGRGFLKSVLDELPHFAAEAFMRYAIYPQLNVTVSNVRGPEATLYVAGARLVHFYPVSIATDYVGLNHTGFSYNGVLWISAVACRNMLPDPGFYADCLRASFEDLMAAIDALPEHAKSRVVPGKKPAATRRATPGASAAATNKSAGKTGVRTRALRKSPAGGLPTGKTSAN